MQSVFLQRPPTTVSINNRGLTKISKGNNYNLTNRERSRREQRQKLELVTACDSLHAILFLGAIMAFLCVRVCKLCVLALFSLLLKADNI